MKSIEFKTTIRRGLIHVPAVYKSMRDTKAKVIVEFDEVAEVVNYDRSLLLHYLNTANKSGLFSEIGAAVSWQKQQRNDWD